MIYRFDGKTPVIGEGTYVAETAVVIGNVTLGKSCYVGPGAIIRGDYGRIVIGSGTAVEEGVIIHAKPGDTSVIGKLVTFGHGAIIHSDIIRDYAVVGMGAVVSIGATVGRWTIVGEGAVVKQGQVLEGGCVYVGAPAKAVRPVLDRDKETWLASKQVYVDLAAKCLIPGMVERVD